MKAVKPTSVLGSAFGIEVTSASQAEIASSLRSSQSPYLTVKIVAV